MPYGVLWCAIWDGVMALRCSLWCVVVVFRCAMWCGVMCRLGWCDDV